MAIQDRGQFVLDLFESHYAHVHRFARRSVDPESAEEIAQEVFVRLLSCSQIEAKTITPSYLIKIADNLLKLRHRKSRIRQRALDHLGRAADLDLDSTSPAASDAAPRSRAVDAYERLGDREREAIRLTVFEGLSYESAATCMGVRASTLNNWKYRGLQRIKDDCA